MANIVYSFPFPTQLENLLPPVNPTDAATKAYVDSQSGGNVGGVIIPAVYFVAPISGNNQVFSNVVLDNYNSNTEMTVYYNGALLENSQYTLNGNQITVNTELKAGDSIDIIRSTLIATATAIPAIYFVAPTTGNNQQFTNVNLAAYKNNSTSMTIFYNGALLENSLYTLTGNTLTINTVLQSGDTIDIITSSVPGANVVQLNVPGGSNTQIQYNDDGRFGASSGLTYNSANSLFTVVGNSSFGNSSVTIQQGAVSIRGNGNSEYALTVGNASGTGDILAVETTTGAGNGITIDVVDSTRANFAPLTIHSNSIILQTDTAVGPELSVVGDMVTLKNFTAQQSANLGAVGNVKVSGGTAGQVLSTDGNGNLSWTSSAPAAAVGSNSQIQFNSNGALGASANLTFASTPNVSDFVNIGNTVSLGGNANVASLQAQNSMNVVSGNGVLNLSATGNIGILSSTGNISLNSTVGNTVFINNGNTMMSLLSNNKVLMTANIIADTSNGDPWTIYDSNGNIKILIDNSNTVAHSLLVLDGANLGNVPNVKIGGGLNGYVLQTDGLGNLSWTAQSGNGGSGNGVPGGANTQVQFNNAGAFGGEPSFTFDSVTQTLFASNVRVSSVTAFDSSLGNITGTIVTPSQTNITSVGRLNTLQVGNGVSNVSITSSGITMPSTTTSFVGSLFVQGSQATLPTAANLTIPGGNLNQVLTSTGNGGVTWAFPLNVQPSTILTATAIPPGTNTILLDVVKNDLGLTQFVNQFRGWVPGGVYRIEISFSTAQVLGNVEARFNAWCSFSTSSTVSSWVQPGQGAVASAPHEGLRTPVGDYLTGTAIGYYIAPPSDGVLYATSFIENLGTTQAANGTVTIIITRLA